MKKLMALMIGMSLALGSVAVIFAQDAPKKDAQKKEDTKKTKKKKAPKKDEAPKK